MVFKIRKSGYKEHNREQDASSATQTDKLYVLQAVPFCYRYYSFLTSFILEYDPKSESLFTRNFSRYVIWRFNMFIVLGIAGFGCCTVTVINYSTMPILNTIFAGIFVPVVGYIQIASFVFNHYKSEMVLAYGRMQFIISTIFLRYENSISANGVAKYSGNWRRIGGFIKTMVISLVIFIPIMLVFLLSHNIDPFYSVYKIYFNAHQDINNMSVFCGRFLLTMIGLAEGSRGYATSVLLLFLWLEMQSKCFNKLQSISHRENSVFCHLYWSCQVAMQTMEISLAEWVRALLGILYLMVVTCNILFVKHFGYIPVYILWVLPFLSWLNLSVLYLLLPFVTEANESTTQMIHDRKRLPMKDVWFQSTLARKQLKSMRPMSIKCGGTFILKRQTKSAFYTAIVERTMEGILV